MSLESKNDCYLAIATASGPVSVAVCENGVVLSELSEAEPGQQSRLLIPMIEQCLVHSGKKYSDLSAIIVCVGPGSFTGLRTGIAASLALGYAAGIEVRGVSALTALAYSHASTSTSFELRLPAGKGQVYSQHFTHAPQFTVLSELTLDDLHEQEKAELQHVSAAALCYLAHQAPGQLLPPLPLYARAPDAKLPQPKAAPYA